MSRVPRLLALFAFLVVAAMTVTDATAVGTGASGSGSGATPSSIAALGASASTGFATADAFDKAPANSWVTGTNPAVKSIYLRLRELSPAIAGHAFNGAIPGSTMSELAAEAARVPRGTDLVTIEMGTNDACASPPTPTRTFRRQFESALSALKARVPRARVIVVSIFDLPAMWDAVKTLSGAEFGRNLCISATDRDRPLIARAIRALNAQLASVCARHRPSCRDDGGAAYRLRWSRRDISTVDYFHPSLSGQRNIAAALWATGLFLPAKR
jgi:lysophospholipase L1-like esterase